MSSNAWADFESIDQEQSTPSKEHIWYALKAYEGRDSKRYHDAETKAFKKLHRTGLRESHIVGYHCCYVHRGAYYAIFELADMGTLEEYMRINPPPSTDADVAAFWASFLPMIEAIVELHDMNECDDDEDDEDSNGDNDRLMLWSRDR